MPTEITTDILRVSLPPGGRVARDKNIRSLCAVQVQWWRQVAACASFWTDVSIKDTPPTTLVKLNRSQNALIDVDCGQGASDTELEQFLPAVTSQSHRWRRLIFSGENVHGRLGSYLEAGTPALEDLTLEEGGDQIGIDFVGGPRLRSVRLRDLDFKDWSVFRDLTSFNIGEMTVGPRFESDLISVLVACPMLEGFGLELIEQADDIQTPSAPTAIHLSHLTYLSLEIIPFSTTLLLQRIIRAECLGEIHVGYGGREGGEQIFALLVQPRDYGPSHLSQVFTTAGINNASMLIQDPNFYLEASGRGNPIVVTVSIDVPKAALLQLGSLLPFAATTYDGGLELIGRTPSTDGDDEPLTVEELLDIFPQTTEFALNSDWRGLATLHYLSEAHDNGWPCERLEKISLSTGFASSVNAEGTWFSAMVALERVVEKRRVSDLPVSPLLYSASTRMIGLLCGLKKRISLSMVPVTS